MFKSLMFASSVVALSSAAAADLTAMETKWLQAASPVLSYARQIDLPLDIIVQPTPGAHDVPLAMGFANGRCKLVLTLRENPQAETTLDGVPEAEHALFIETMAAHEIGHCWRYAQGVWHTLPAGFTETSSETGTPELLAMARQQRETRREEGFADLVALAWTQQHHPAEYARVHQWIAALRADQPVPRGAHDTRVWVRLGRDASVFASGANPFEAARAPWDQGLLNNG